MIKTPTKTKIFGYSSLQECLKSLDFLTYQRKTNEKEYIMRNKKMNILEPKHVKRVMRYLEDTSRQLNRDKTMFNLSLRQGLRSIEISNLQWKNVLDTDGVDVTFKEWMVVTNDQSKGKSSGREIPIHKDTRESLTQLLNEKFDSKDWVLNKKKDIPKLMNSYVIVSQQLIGNENEGNKLSNVTVTNWFHRLYKELGMVGFGSHSGRRTFITEGSKKISLHGGSLRDVMELCGHSSIQTTQGYIESSPKSKMDLLKDM